MDKEKIEKMRMFIVELLQEYGDGGDIDGFTFEEIALKHGILNPVKRFAPCVDNDVDPDASCQCAQYFSDEEFKNGITCHVVADWIFENHT